MLCFLATQGVGILLGKLAMGGITQAKTKTFRHRMHISK